MRKRVSAPAVSRDYARTFVVCAVNECVFRERRERRECVKKGWKTTCVCV